MLAEFLWSGDFLLVGSGDLDSDKVEERDLSLVTDLRLLSIDLDGLCRLGDLETVFCLLSFDLDGLLLLGDLETFFCLLSLDLYEFRLLGDLETVFCLLSLDLEELRLLGDLETLFCLLSLDLDGLRVLEEDLLRLLGCGDFALSLLLSGLLALFSLERFDRSEFFSVGLLLSSLSGFLLSE